MFIATVVDGGNTSVDFTVANVLGYISSKSLIAYAVDVIKRKIKSAECYIFFNSNQPILRF
jgi:hypothetical protein